jgi:hypothetical protein
MTQSIKQRMPKIPDLLTSRELTPLLQAMQTDIAALSAALNQLRTDYNAHVHGGVTAGAADTDPTTATTATAVTPTITA